MPRSEVLPRPGQKFGLSFMLHLHRCSTSGTTTSGTKASPKPGNSPKKRVDRMGGDTSAVKKKHDRNPMAERANGEHQVWKAKGRAMATNTGESPGHQSQSQ